MLCSEMMCGFIHIFFNLVFYCILMISMMSWDYAINPGFVGLFSECQVVGLLIVLVSNIINEALLGFLLRFSCFLAVVLD